MRKYESPRLDMIMIENKDIIQTSGVQTLTKAENNATIGNNANISGGSAIWN